MVIIYSNGEYRPKSTIPGFGYNGILVEVMRPINNNKNLKHTCPRCNSENLPGSQTCRECHTDLNTSCTDCGHKVRTTAKFCDECGIELAAPESESAWYFKINSLASSVQLPSRRIHPNAIQMKGERKNVTVLFTDISGFTKMSEKLDPEEVIDILNNCFDKLTEIIYRYEGTVDKYMGDCIIALFGAPVAHEDDPERAVKTAMEIMEALDELNKTLPIPIHMHVGINTGLVVAGSIGSYLRKQYTVIGDTVNTASRIQSAAQSGQILVGESVYTLTKDVFNFDQVGEITVKGKEKPIKVYLPLSMRPIQSRFNKLKSKGLSPFVGREHELALLKNLFSKLIKGEGCIVGISADPGVGKSRLLHEFFQQISSSSITFLEGQCKPYGRISPYQPFIDIVAQYLGLLEPVTEDKREYLKQKLDGIKEHISCFEEFFSLEPSDKNYNQLSPEIRRRKTFEGLGALFQQASVDRPLVLVLDDLQWMDETSLEFLDWMMKETEPNHIMLILVSRPEFQPPWKGLKSYISIQLTSLPVTQGYTLVRALFDAPVSKKLQDFIMDRTEGNPFFIEELIHNLRETNSVDLNGSYSFVMHFNKLNIPQTVHGVLAARIDRLDTQSKNILQVASVIGRELNIRVLEKVSELESTDLIKNLDNLTRNGFTMQIQNNTSYTFKHALTRDVAYETLLKSSRRILHRKAADAIKQVLPYVIETQPELLAHHYTEAELFEIAIPLWQSGGRKAIQRSSNVEAVSHLTKGLELLNNLADSPMRVQQEIDVLTTIGPALMATKGPASAEVKRVYDRAKTLCEQVGQSSLLFPVFFGLWRFYLLRANFEVAQDLANRLVKLVNQNTHQQFLMDTYFIIGVTSFWRGDFQYAHRNFEKVIAMYDPQLHYIHTFLLGQDPLFVCLSYDAFILWTMGYPDQSLKKISEAVNLARNRNHPFSLAYALFGTSKIYQLRHDHLMTYRWAEEAIILSTDNDFPYFGSISSILKGWSVVEKGDIKGGIIQIQDGLANLKMTESAVNKTYYLALLAEAHKKNGDVIEGQKVVSEALDMVSRNKELWYESELYRIKGDLAIMADKNELEAEKSYLIAIDLANRRMALSFELRSVLSLFHLWKKRGKIKEAQKMLRAVFEKFTEGFETKDIQEARTILESLQ
ncbi:adenylate/guanylate cyclase domain-containing protein [Candidatus Nitrosocosmicus sp. T]